MSKTRVGVLRGGVGSEYEVSLKTGGNVLKHIPRDTYKVLDLLITKNGEWHIDGFPVTPEKLSRNVDVVFNALHGEFGEDGKVQNMLERSSISYTGAAPFASAMAMNKFFAKKLFLAKGLKTPYSMVVRSDDSIADVALKIFKTVPAPYIVKPLAGGSSIGVSLVRDFSGLIAAIEHASAYYPSVLVEEYIEGREVTCGVIESSDGKGPYAIHPLEIIISERADFFDYRNKYNGETQEICPANLLRETTETIRALAVSAHKALGLRHYSRADFILSKRGVFLLEVNSLPGLTEESLFPKAFSAGGLPFSDFLDRMLALALVGE
ncbi:MAG: D-alanine--D-alanine ligase [Patescibacteria group bacterium]|nr:MAG: D-alanine--D-alanine ligase [Patescibacteria group bacterium]